MRVSDGLPLSWRIAAREAPVGHLPEIEPAHLLIGLCKLCDLGAAQVRALV